MRNVIKLPVIITLFASCGVPILSQAEDPCEWAQCSSQSSSAMALPACTKDQRLACQNECHGKFDNEFGACVSTCLARSCSTDSQSNEWQNRGNQDDEALCLELESESCVTSCQTSGGAMAARCRRACLEQHCPDAPKTKAAEEAMDPGITRCERCRKKSENLCGQQCLAGVSVYRESNGLINLGCQKACLMSVCAASCGARFPLN